MQFMSNNGPFAGKEGKYVTSRNLRDRLFKEMKSNVALRVEETASPDTFDVLGRGELHLTVLIETMRREGYELMVSQPQVIFKTGENGEKTEPYEEVVIDLDEAYSGAIIEELGRRGGRMQEMGPAGEGRMRLEYLCPARGLIGYRSQFLTDTRGTGHPEPQLQELRPVRRARMRSRPNGVLISQDDGETNTYGLFYLQERGQLFLGPADQGLRRADHRPALARQRPGRQPVEGQEADQHPHHGRRREAVPHPAARVHAGVGAGVHQRRRAGRGHARSRSACASAPSTTTSASAWKRSAKRAYRAISSPRAGLQADSSAARPPEHRRGLFTQLLLRCHG